MNIFKKNEKNTGNRLPTPDKVKKSVLQILDYPII